MNAISPVPLYCAKHVLGSLWSVVYGGETVSVWPSKTDAIAHATACNRVQYEILEKQGYFKT